MSKVKPGSPIDPLVCPRGHHSVKIDANRFQCRTCESQGRETRSWDRSELVDLRDEDPPLRGDREIVTDGGTDRWDAPIANAGDVYDRARQQWGDDAQLSKLAEESAELSAVAARALNGQADPDAFLEELVDARIMIEQMAHCYTPDRLEPFVAEGVEGLDRRLDADPEIASDGGAVQAENSFQSVIRTLEPGLIITVNCSDPTKAGIDEMIVQRTDASGDVHLRARGHNGEQFILTPDDAHYEAPAIKEVGETEFSPIDEPVTTIEVVGVSSAAEQRWCDGCEDETPHRQVAPADVPGQTHKCLACPERLEIEAALGIGDVADGPGGDGDAE